MRATVQAEHVKVASKDLERITKIYDKGLYLEAYQEAEKIGPLPRWTGTRARILAGRLAGNLGGPRLGEWHFIRAWRHDRTDPEASWFFGRYLLDAHGPWKALQFLTSQGTFPAASIEIRSYWLSLHAMAHGRVRDFAAAENWLAQAESLGWDHPWIHLERAALCTLEDKHEEAMAAAQTALKVRPWYRPAVQWLAHFHVQKEQDEEALALLSEAARRLESSAIWSQLANLQMELGRHEEARQSLEEFARLAPLLDKGMAEWLAARRSDAAYYCGAIEQSREHAKKVKGRFFETQVQRLENPPKDGKRVSLPVGFVRQHFQTCAPATLSALCRFWEMPGDHLEMAAAITYAGTPSHSQRQWAMDNGWFTREFTVTWEGAVALLDQGIPFALTTVEVTSSHLQAVIGYDSIRGTLIIRDPGERHQSEFLAEGLTERYASTGPHGMALVPIKDKHKLASLELPDAELYDSMFQMDKSLQLHDRGKAETICRELEAKAGKHRLAYLARRTLAVYDYDTPSILAVTEKQLKLFPDDLRWLLAKVDCLRNLARRAEYLEILKKVSEQKTTDPAYWQQYAQELADDAREHPRALHLLRRLLRCNPSDARTYHCLARIHWDKRQFAEAFDLYRIAACLEETDEHLARSYFQAANCLGKTDEATEFLQQRFERFGSKSGQPARTLSWAYFQLERTGEGFAVLQKALRQRPDDADLLLYAVDQRIQYGSFAEARQLLIQAKGKSQKTAWLRSTANLAASQGDLEIARKVWAKILEVEPLADDAHGAYAHLLAETKGRAAALKHLHKTCDRFPYNFQLQKLLVEWLHEDGPEAVEPVVRKLIDIHPANAWALRELALVLADQNRMDEAFAALEEAERLEPDCINYHTVRARLMSLAGRMDEAKECYREALRISVDLEHAMNEWIDACETDEELREALAFIEEELVRQVISGAGLLTFREVARQTLEPDELLVSLREFLEKRPDLWQSWSAVIRQLRDMEQHEEALETAQLALERFPLLPELWVDLSEVYQAQMNGPAAIKALEKALKINSGWAYPLRLLADLYQREGQGDQAKTLVQRAIDRAPLLSANHFTMAMVLWNNGERDQGLERIRQTVLLDPGYEMAWDYLCDWSAELGRFQGVVDLARGLTEKRPGETRSWMRLAQALLRMPPSPDVDQDERVQECLHALQRVHQLSPRLVDAYDLEAQVLAEAGRFDDAQKACQSAVWNGKAPITLRGRSAWLLAQNNDVPQAIEKMRAILKEDPVYFWGWTKLAEWYEGTGNHQNYLSAAQQMVRLAPQSPIAWAYRGDAKLLLGDRKSGKKDLRMACHIAPDYSFAGLKLFDEQLADAGASPDGTGHKELARARKTLIMLYHHVRDDLVKTRLVQWFALRRKEKQAIRAFVQICRSASGGPWPVETAAQAMEEAGWQGRVQQIYQKVLAEDSWNPNVAIQWAAGYDPDMDNELEGRLEALDRARPLMPDPLRPIDLKAELLTKAGRFDEALEACEDPPPGTEIPIRGRAAWIEYQRGDKKAAIKRMNKVVADDPDYYWGFCQLADWNEELGQHEEHLAAAEKLTELAPDNPVSFVHRAQAKRALEDLKGARDDYQHAADMAPDYVFPAFCLFQMHLEAGNTKGAERVLSAVREHCSPGDFALRSIQLAVAKDETESALEDLEQLCKAGEDADELLEQGVKALEDAGLDKEIDDVLFRFLGAGAAVCKQWVGLAKRRGKLPGIRQRIEKMPEKHHGKRHAIEAYAAALGKVEDRRGLHAWVDKYHDLLRKDTMTWGMIGSNFSASQDDQAVLDWMSDWQERDDAQPWMLINLSLALRGLGRFKEANRVNQFALEELVPDYSSGFHSLWLILDEALAGNEEALEDYFEEHTIEEHDPNHQWIATLVQAILISLKDESGAFAEARQLLVDAAADIGPIDRDKVFLVAYQRAVAAIAKNCGGLTGGIWKWYRSKNPILPKRKEVGEE